MKLGRLFGPLNTTSVSTGSSNCTSVDAGREQAGQLLAQPRTMSSASCSRLS